jgi:hypothetical protein
LKEEALDRNLWRTRFGRGYGPVVRQTTEWMNEWFVTYIEMMVTGHAYILATLPRGRESPVSRK